MRVRTRMLAALLLGGALHPVCAALAAERISLQLVVLERGPGAEEGADHGSARLQKAQTRYLNLLMEGEQVVLAGDVADGGPIRSVALLDAGSTERAEEIMRGSPSVGAGRLVPRVYGLLAASNALGKPTDPSDRTTCYLGLIRPNRKRRTISAEELKRIREAHAEIVARLVERPEVALAGSIEGEDDLSEVLLFRGGSESSIEAAFAEDPAIATGVLRLQLLRWQVPRGSLGAT